MAIIMAHKYAKVGVVQGSSDLSNPPLESSQDNTAQVEARGISLTSIPMPVLEIPPESPVIEKHRWCCCKVRNRTTEELDRLNFIRKVYALIFLQLGITVGWIAFTACVEPVRVAIASHTLVIFAPLGLMLVILAVMFCAPQGVHKVPWNYFLLLAFVRDM
jgi:hypothetical protein